MSTLKKIIFLFLPILSFSCQTQLEKQGWQRTTIVSELDSSTIKKDKELVVQKKYIDKSSYYYVFYISEKHSTGKITCRVLAGAPFLKSDIAYYKLESDSVCLIKLLNQGNIQASIKIGFGSWTSLEVLDEPKRALVQTEGLRGTALVSQADTSVIKKGKQLVVERMQLEGLYYYNLTFVKKDATGKLINKPFSGFNNSFKSDMAYYKWESDSSCLIRLMSHGIVQASYKYIEYSDSSSSFGILDDLK